MTMHAHGMADGRSAEHRNRHGGAPPLVAAVVAILGVSGMLIVDARPWSKAQGAPVGTPSY